MGSWPRRRRRGFGIYVGMLSGFHARRCGDVWHWTVLTPNGERESGESESPADARADARDVLRRSRKAARA